MCIPESLREDLVSTEVSEVVKQLVTHSDEKVQAASKSVIPHLEASPNVER